jgi:hypothetical protein
MKVLRRLGHHHFLATFSHILLQKNGARIWYYSVTIFSNFSTLGYKSRIHVLELKILYLKAYLTMPFTIITLQNFIVLYSCLPKRSLISFHPEMALFCNLCVNPPEADESAGFLVRRTRYTSPRNPLISPAQSPGSST